MSMKLKYNLLLKEESQLYLLIVMMGMKRLPYPGKVFNLYFLIWV